MFVCTKPCTRDIKGPSQPAVLFLVLLLGKDKIDFLLLSSCFLAYAAMFWTATWSAALRSRISPR
jgi:hypothetical protein